MLSATSEQRESPVAFRPGVVALILAVRLAATFRWHSGRRFPLDVVTGAAAAEQRQVLIAGAGLTLGDVALSLGGGERGPRVRSASRRGLVPGCHRREEKRRFLREVQRLWNVHRFRLAAAVADRLEGPRTAGRVRDMSVAVLAESSKEGR